MEILATTHYGNWYPPQYSVHGGQIDRLIDVLHVFMFAIFIPWGIFFIYCLFNFRARSGHNALYTPIKAKVSKYAEVGVAIFEMVLLVGFSMPVWAAYKNDPPPEGQRVEVRAIGEQFQWDFHYAGKDGMFGKTDSRLITASNPIGLVESDTAAADDIVLINEFHIPVGKPIYVRLTSKDVIHSFSIPTMRVKQDVVPGMEIPIWFTADSAALTDTIRQTMTQEFSTARVNWYRVRHHVAAVDHKSRSGEIILPKGADIGLDNKAGMELLEKLRGAGVETLTLQPAYPLEVVCAQLCGNSHFKMKGNMITHTEADFAKWVEESGKKQKLEVDF